MAMENENNCWRVNVKNSIKFVSVIICKYTFWQNDMVVMKNRKSFEVLSVEA